MSDNLFKVYTSDELTNDAYHDPNSWCAEPSRYLLKLPGGVEIQAERKQQGANVRHAVAHQL